LKKVILVAVILLLTLLVVVGCAQPAAPGETTKTVTTTVTAGAGATATVTAPAKTVTSTITAAAEKQEVYKWDAQYFLPRGHATFPVYQSWCDDVRTATNGQIDITLYGVGEIVPGLEVWEATSKGMMDLCLSYGGYWHSKTLMAAYSTGVPYTMRDATDYYTLMHELGLEDMIREGYAEYNLYYLRGYPTNTISLLSTFPVTKVADLEGKKLRATGLIADAMVEAGASTVYFPLAEIYGALEKGVIEGATGCIVTQYGTGLHEVTQYYLASWLSTCDASETFLCMDSWNALPDNIKTTLYASTSSLGVKLAALYRAEETKLQALIAREHGVKLTYMPDEEKAIMAGYMVKLLDERSLEDPLFAKATAVVKDYMRAEGLLKD